MKKNFIASLDLGTTKTCLMIAEVLENNKINVLGYGVAPSEGLNRGLVVNIGKTAEAIKEAYAIASNRAGIEIISVNVGVAGEHIMSIRNRNYVTITNDEHEITENDLKRLEEDIKRIRIPSDRQILHIIPEEYYVDYNDGIENPIGMSGEKLEATSHLVLASIPAIENIRKSVERAGLHIYQYILQPIASSLSVLEDSERDLGVLLIDIGGGTTDIAVIHKKAIKYSKVFGIAGNQVTNDIRETLGIITEEAENLKKEYGYATTSSIIKDEDILIRRVAAMGSTKIPISLLTQIISLRMRELFTIIDNELRNSNFKNKIRAGIVLTGGGSLLKGCEILAQEVFGLPARIGIPLESITGKLSDVEKPEFATAIGLLLGMKNNKTIETKSFNKKNNKNILTTMWNNIRNFFEDF
ncbi:MAG: cell division protein FtsA [Ignavibacterium sp.]